ncbi:MAG: outer membrane beta-barrel protein [bacterium]|nr:outer membrane beta-barrel protein [bacterium]
MLKIGAYAGYFSPTDENIKEIYEGEDVTYGLKLGIRVWGNFSVWLSGMRFNKTAETTLLNDITTITLNPAHLTLRYTFKLGGISPYLEGGYSYIFFNEASDIGTTKGEGKGYCFDAGLELKLSSRFMMDVGVKYSQAEVRPTGFDVQLGGLQGGVAFLVVF